MGDRREVPDQVKNWLVLRTSGTVQERLFRDPHCNRPGYTGKTPQITGSLDRETA